VLLILCGLALLGCSKQTPPPPAPPDVAVLAIQPRTVEDQYEFVGEVQAFRRVEVRAQVSGVIVERPFREGAEVKANDVLYRIDPRTYEAALRGARARLAESEARLANAETNAGRLRPLLEYNAVAKAEVDNAEAELKQARALVDDARASVDQAQKELDYTVVRAEISGRVGRAVLDLGTRVTALSDMLTTIDQLDPVYVSFRPSGQQLLAWKRDPHAARALQPGGSVQVQALLPDGHTVPHTGRISFVDPVVDLATGTQQFRAEFDNSDRLLVPGQFIRVRLQGLTRDSAILVPQRAVVRQMGRQSVYVVGKGDSVGVRDVEGHAWLGEDWLIDRGLRAGDRVIVDGVQKVRPGDLVKPTQLAMPQPSQAAMTSSSGDGGQP
jgi:membrane fusion protein (multidrug efflux system)